MNRTANRQADHNHSRPRPKHLASPLVGPLCGILVVLTGCIGLNYPAETTPADSSTNPSSTTSMSSATSSSTVQADDTDASSAPQGPPVAPVLLSTGFGVPEINEASLAERKAAAAGEMGANQATGDAAGKALPWYALTRLAREELNAGDLDSARTRLEQASIQLADRPDGNAQRQAVIAMQARLAMSLAAINRLDDANILADTIIDDVRAEPKIAGPAVAEMAAFFAISRQASAEASANDGESPEADETAQPASQLLLWEVALNAAEQDTPSEQRMNLAYQVSEHARVEGNYALARRAIDLAVLDSQIIAASNKDQIASLRIFKSRIALSQGDLPTAEASSTYAIRLFDEMNAPAANLAIAESTLAHVLAKRGDLDRAQAIATGARARLATAENEPAIEGHAARLVLSELARFEQAAGNLNKARQVYDEALAIPAVKTDSDRTLIRELTDELNALSTE